MNLLYKCIRNRSGFTLGTHYLIDLDYTTINDNKDRVSVATILYAFEAVVVGISGTAMTRYIALRTTGDLEEGVIYYCDQNGQVNSVDVSINIYEYNASDYSVFPTDISEVRKEKVEKLKAPPLGFIPEYIWEERVNRERLTDLLATVERYNKEDFPVPNDLRDEIVKRALICFKTGEIKEETNS